jgi:hypothetical protein
VRYSVPFKVHDPQRSTKAKIGEGDRSVQFEASTEEEARRTLRSLILPGDPRTVMGRRNVGRYKVGDR